jgi:1-acyl-sn-glycerol-3-phosphate acyltransferase
VARPFLRPLIVWPLAALAMSVAVFICFALWPFMGRRQAFWFIAPKYLALMAKAFGIHPQVEGWERLPEGIRKGDQPVIFFGNHASLFDPPLVVATLPTHPVFIAKKELAYVPVLGWVIWLAQFILIDRSNRARAIASLHDAAKRIHAGQSIIAFPEGTRTRSDEVLPFKKGVFNLAIDAQVPLVPLAIFGGREILPADDWRVKGGTYRMVLGEPIESSQFPDPDALREVCERELKQLLAGS